MFHKFDGKYYAQVCVTLCVSTFKEMNWLRAIILRVTQSYIDFTVTACFNDVIFQYVCRRCSNFFLSTYMTISPYARAQVTLLLTS